MPPPPGPLRPSRYTWRTEPTPAAGSAERFLLNKKAKNPLGFELHAGHGISVAWTECGATGE